MRWICTNSSTIITAFESACDFLLLPSVPHEVNMMTHIPKLQLAGPTDQEDLPIEILVGGDHHWKIVKYSPPLRISPSVMLLPSSFGWAFSGNRSGISVNVAAVKRFHLEEPDPLPETEIKRFWDLETTRITVHQDGLSDTKDSAVLQVFHIFFRTDDS
jgi:hypothetical protein